MQQLLNGLFLGSIYALFAIGFTLVFGILDRLNLAHPAVFAAAAFVGIELVAVGGLSIWVALPLVAVFGAVLGLVIERVAFRPLKGRPDAHFAGLIGSIGLGGMFIALLLWRYGPDTRRFPVDAFPSTTFEVAGAQAPEGTIGAGGDLAARVDLLVDPGTHRLQATLLVVLTALLLVVPTLLVVLPWFSALFPRG